jgi:hypothetical protein
LCVGIEWASPRTGDGNPARAVAGHGSAKRCATWMQFTVGLKLNGKTDHIAVDAGDALIAALKVKTEHPEAVRPPTKSAR